MACLCVWVASASAAPLTVAVKASPPFSFQNGDRWDGVSVELWEQIAEQAGYDLSQLADRLDQRRGQ